MPFTLTMPKMSPTMEEGSIAKWHKKVGDHVEADDLLFEVATDKATVEYNALDEGWLKKILVKDGEEAKVNQPVAIFTEKEDESIEGYQTPDEEPKETKPATEKPPVKSSSQPSPVSPQPQPVRTQAQFTPEQPLEKYEHLIPSESSERILASPLAKRLAKEKSLDLSSVQGSGPNKRIMSRDLEYASPLGSQGFGRKGRPKEKPGSYTEEALTPMRKVISQRLQEAKSFIPHFYVQQVVDAEPLTNLRQQLTHLGIKVTFNDCLIKACSLALVDHPTINSGFNSVNNTIIRFKTIDIGVAVTIPGGLITPIIRYADYKSMIEISQEIRQLAQKAKEGKLDPQEYKGGSFTISNLGMYGVTNFQAIINPPQAAILAVSGIIDSPIIKNGAILPGKTLSLTLSVDHRVIDGVAAAEFMKTLQKILENPAALTL